MSQKLLIWGASGHALVVADIIRSRGEYEIIGFIDDLNPARYGTDFNGAPILGGREKLDKLARAGIENLICAVGDCEARLNLAAFAKSKGFSLAAAIHPRAIVAADVKVGTGTVIAAGAVVNPGSTVGQHAIVNTCASIDHECLIEDGAHIGPGAHLGGRVSVGRATWIGIGAVVKDSVKIGAGAIIGAGTVVLEDIPESVVAYGIPARVKRRVTQR
ncbi:MAG: acetyltransferase [bacterium]